jgi:hypothetical protein
VAKNNFREKELSVVREVRTFNFTADWRPDINQHYLTVLCKPAEYQPAGILRVHNVL